MSYQTNGELHAASIGGVSGLHPEPAPFELLVSSATGNERNTARLRPIPVACWRVDDIRFAFDSSFVTAEIAAELQTLVSLREAHQKKDAGGHPHYPPLSIFGHADPVGSDDYNKALSGRRARAIYALIISGADPAKAVSLWDEIAGTEHWGADQNQAMQKFTGLGVGSSRHELFRAYMDKLRPAALQVAAKDFLGQGVDAAGKGDYQGCSEFNPLLIFSEEEQSAFEKAQQEKDQTVLAERNSANSSNRRVLVLLFRPGSKVDPAKWPCPRATESIGGCRKRFWSDGEQRRSRRLPKAERSFVQTQDTFACRFFQRLSTGSPCQSFLRYFRVRLYDPTGKFIAFAPYRITIGKTTQPPLTADEKGIIAGQSVEVPNRCLVEWAFPPPPEDRQKPVDVFPFKAEVFLSFAGDDDKHKTLQMLNNLGYPLGGSVEENATDFQSDYQPAFGLRVTGKIDASTKNVVQQVHSQCADNLRSCPGAKGQQN